MRAVLAVECDGFSSCPKGLTREHYDRESGRMECDDCDGGVVVLGASTAGSRQCPATIDVYGVTVRCTRERRHRRSHTHYVDDGLDFHTAIYWADVEADG